MAIQQSVDGPIRELALFAGAGGGILGGKLLGWRTVCAVERDAYAAQVLAQRQTDGALEPFPIWSDVCSFDGKRWRGRVDGVSCGFPCQDISAAGKGAGIEGEKSGLWKECKRIIREVRPRFVLVENSPRLTSRGLHRVLGDLAEMGYDAQWGCVSAADAIWLDGTPALDHERERIWIVAHDANSDSVHGWSRAGTTRAKEWSQVGNRSSANTSDANANIVNDDRSGHGASEDVGQQQESSVVLRSKKTSSNTARIQQGRKEQRSIWKRIRPGCESHGETKGNSTGITTSMDAVQLLRGILVQSPRHARVRMSMFANRRTGHRSLLNRRIGDGPECSSDNDLQRCEEQQSTKSGESEFTAAECCGWWQSEPNVDRVAHGIPYRVDRLKAIGNAQVPAVVPLAFDLISAFIDQ